MSGFKPQINLSFKPVLFTALALLNVAFVFAQIPKDPKLLKEKIAESAPDSNRADLLLDLGTYCLNKPGESKSDMDSAMLLGQQALNISSKLKYHKGIGRSLLLKGQVYREKGDRKRSQAQLQNAIAYCSPYGLNEQIGEAYMAMSFLFGIEGADLDKRIVYSEKAAEYFEKGSLMIPRARTLESLGDLYQLKNDFDHSITLLKQAIAIYDAEGYRDTQGVLQSFGTCLSF
jgi:tetratricopeptide (TPR) repeat protein